MILEHEEFKKLIKVKIEEDEFNFIEKGRYTIQEILEKLDNMILKERFDYDAIKEKSEAKIEDLEEENYILKEKYEQLKRDVEDNYRQLGIEEQI